MTSSQQNLKRTLTVRDVSFLVIAAVFNINVAPVVAASGAVTICLYILAIAVFFIPEGIAVTELSHRYPQEGGIYLWTKRSFGEFHGFLCGWCYWTNNMLYLPSVLLYLTGIGVYVLGRRHAALADDKMVILIAAVCTMSVLLVLNLIGSSIGKWISNIGALGSLVSALVLIVLGGVFCLANGTSLSLHDFRVPTNPALMFNSLGVVVFALTGLELASVMGDEIREPKRTVPIAIGIGAIACGLLYVSCDFVLLISLGRDRINVLQGMMQAIVVMTQQLKIEWVVPIFAAILCISIAGTASAWLAGSARVPFVAGLDHYLPGWLGKVHPVYGTPYTALLFMGAVSIVFIAINVMSSGAQESFQRLLSLAIVLQLIPFVYMFTALLKIALSRAALPGRYNKSTLFVAGTLGLVTTCFGLAFMLVPPGETSVWAYESWMVIGLASFFVIAALLYLYFRLPVSSQPRAAFE